MKIDTKNHTTRTDALLKISDAIQKMQNPSDISEVMQICLGELQRLGIASDGLIVHQIVDADSGTIKTCYIFADEVAGETTEKNQYSLVARWKGNRIFYEKDLDSQKEGYLESFHNYFNDSSPKSFIDISFSGGIFSFQSLQKEA